MGKTKVRNKKKIRPQEYPDYMDQEPRPKVHMRLEPIVQELPGVFVPRTQNPVNSGRKEGETVSFREKQGTIVGLFGAEALILCKDGYLHRVYITELT